MCLCLCCPPMVMVINLSTNPYRYARQASFSLLISLLSASYYYRMSTNMNFMNFVLLLYYFIYIFYELLCYCIIILWFLVIGFDFVVIKRQYFKYYFRFKERFRSVLLLRALYSDMSRDCLDCRFPMFSFAVCSL